MKSVVRWMVPVAAAALVAGVALAQSANAGAGTSLAARPVTDVLAEVASSQVQAFSGMVMVSADLGLPTLATQGGGAPSADDPLGVLTRLMTGQSTLRVWADGAQRQRVQLLDPLSELDVVHNGQDLWTYSSGDQVATHTVLTARTGAAAPAPTAQTAPADMTPGALARRVLSAADPTTRVTAGDPTRVAGRAAYTIVVAPRASGSLVGRIVVAVDASTGAPLMVQVFARGQAAPALQSAFTSFDPSRPAASIFSFSTPRGAVLHDLSLPTRQAAPTTHPSVPAADRPTVIGTGWTAVLQVPAGLAGAALQRSPAGAVGGRGQAGSGSSGALSLPGGSMATLLTAATVVPEGRLLRTALLSVLIGDDGRLWVGAVTPDVLRAAARG